MQTKELIPNANEIPLDPVCQQFIVKIAEEAFDVDLRAASVATAKFRIRLQENGLPYEPGQRGHFLASKDVKELLDQNDKAISGLKIYFAEFKNGEKTHLGIVVVATAGSGTTTADDYNLPEDAGTQTTAKVKNAMPCPSQCGKRNCLNTI